MLRILSNSTLNHRVGDNSILDFESNFRKKQSELEGLLDSGEQLIEDHPILLAIAKIAFTLQKNILLRKETLISTEPNEVERVLNTYLIRLNHATGKAIIANRTVLTRIDPENPKNTSTHFSIISCKLVEVDESFQPYES